MSLVQCFMGRRREEAGEVHQQHIAAPSVSLVMPPQLLLQAPEAEVQPLSLYAGPVVVDHAGAEQGEQAAPGQGLVLLPVLDVRRVYGPGLSPLPDGEAHVLVRPPFPVQQLSPLPGGTGEQVGLEPLGGLLPPHSVAAPPAGHVEGIIPENAVYAANAAVSFLQARPSGCAPPLVSRLSALFAGHKSFFRPPYKCLVGCRLICFAGAHETG